MTSIWYLKPLAFIHELFYLLGVAVIIIGSFVALFHFMQAIVVKNTKSRFTLAHLRSELGGSIVLGLDFMVAADVIQTVLAPDYYELGMLGALVLIRITLSYFLGKELEFLPK